MPLISVVIPALNAAQTLGETLQSLANQSLRDFEVVLVDDGSTDDTAALAARFEGLLNLRRIAHADPQGVARSLNDGLAAGDSEFVARLDADDLAHPERLRLQLEF
ncbi:MAG: glycosyltransferase, partial [Rubrivivax sp.]